MSDMMDTTKQQDAWHKACRRVGNDNMLSIGTWVAAYVDERLAAEAAKAQPAEPRAEGDVPEWFGTAVRSIVLATDTMVRDAWSIASQHIARRVAEATAYKDKRIAELESECERLKERHSAMQEDRDSHRAAYRAFSSQLDTLRQQLAEATRPVEDVDWRQLWRDYATSGAMTSHDSCMAMKRIYEPLLQAERAARVAAEIKLAEATKPVEDERSFFASDANGDVSEVVGVLQFRRERAARVAAEAERDELREAYKKFFPCRNHVGVYEGHRRYGDVPDIAIDAVLAAYRAEKGKVQACPTGG